jgi:hypothetical protein
LEVTDRLSAVLGVYPDPVSKGRTKRVLRVLQGGLNEKGLTRKFENFLVKPDAGKKSPA